MAEASLSRKPPVSHNSPGADHPSSRQKRGRLQSTRIVGPVRYNNHMEFTLDGEPFELTSQLVRARLDGHRPEGIREYWVEVDGVRWPVKQVIALATGAKRSRFQSQDSRRWLANLGFAIGSDAGPAVARPVSGQRTATARVKFDSDTLPVLESLDVRVVFDWMRAGQITLDGAGLPKFPPLPRLPGLYRYDFGLDENAVRTLYIGESVELARRASNYRNAKTDRSRQRTSRRIHKEIVQHLQAGRSIDFAIATRVQLGDGRATDLRLKSARRLAENAAVLIAQTAPSTRVLNIDADPSETEGEE